MTVRSCRASLAFACALWTLGAREASAQWITFTDETSTRLPSDAAFTSDPDEKNFAVVDIDHDGDMDIVDVHAGLAFNPPLPRPHRLLLNDGAGAFADVASALAPGFLANPSIARAPVVRDFDGDGWEDVVVVTYNDAGCTTGNQLQFYRNLGLNGAGAWLGLVYDTAGRFPQYVAPCARFKCGDGGDVDNDGDVDLYLGDYVNGLEDVLLVNDGTGHFADETLLRIPGGTATYATIDVFIRDFNNDGWNDVVRCDGTFGDVKVRVNVGAANPGHFAFVAPPVPSALTYTLAVGDLDNDGWLDLYQGRQGQDAYNLNTTSGVGQTPTFATLMLNSSPGTAGFEGNVQIVDMDKDGMRDVVMGSVADMPLDCSQHATILRNVDPATPLLTDPYAAGPGCAPGAGGCQNFHVYGTHDIAVLDLNGDGRQDMVYGLCTGYRAFIQNPPPFSITLTEPAPGGWDLFVESAPANYPLFNFASLIQMPLGSTGPFFGLDASAWTLWTALYPLPPTVGMSDALGQYAYGFPAGTFVQTFPWTWQLRSAYLTGSSVVLSNIVTRTF